MNGIILALVAIVCSLAGALLAPRIAWSPKEPAAAQREPRGDFVTREELLELLSEERRKVDWANEEWHEKFSTLHARLAKRLKSKEQIELMREDEEVPQRARVSSVLNHRRITSP